MSTAQSSPIIYSVLHPAAQRHTCSPVQKARAAPAQNCERAETHTGHCRASLGWSARTRCIGAPHVASGHHPSVFAWLRRQSPASRGAPPRNGNCRCTVHRRGGRSADGPRAPGRRSRSQMPPARLAPGARGSSQGSFNGVRRGMLWRPGCQGAPGAVRALWRRMPLSAAVWRGWQLEGCRSSRGSWGLLWFANREKGRLLAWEACRSYGRWNAVIGAAAAERLREISLCAFWPVKCILHCWRNWHM